MTKLCCLTGILAGALGVLVGAMLVAALKTPPPATPKGLAQTENRLPVQLATRQRQDGKGVVLQIRNGSSSPLRSVRIRLETPDHTPPKTLEFDSWEPGAIVEIGDNDGWQVAAGQRLFIVADGYPPSSLTLN